MADSLHDRVRRLREQTEAQNREHELAAKHSRSARVRADIATTGRFTYQVGQGLLWIRRRIGKPIWRWMVAVGRRLIEWYARLWAYVVYKRTSDNVLVFSKTRAGVMLLSTFVFLWFLLLPVAKFFLDAALYAATAQVDEKVYLLGSQETDSTFGTHTVEGCSELPCTDQDAIYFHAENSLFNHVWSLIHNGTIFFAEYVGAAVPYTTSECTITSYGVRFKITSRFLNIFPYLLAVSCTGEIKPADKPHIHH